MSLHYIIDGYNAIKHHAFLSVRAKADDERRQLIRSIESKKLCGSPKNKVTIVFDGREGVFSPKLNTQFEIIFTKGESADERIKQIVAQSKNPKLMVVISDDKEIAFFIRSLGARHLSIDEFMGIKSTNKKKSPRELPKVQLSYSEVAKINEELRKIWLR